MKTLEDIKKVIQLHKEDLRKEYGVKEIGIFGSYVKGEQIDISDVDILIELEKPMGFVRYMKLGKSISEVK